MIHDIYARGAQKEVNRAVFCCNSEFYGKNQSSDNIGSPLDWFCHETLSYNKKTALFTSFCVPLAYHALPIPGN